MIEFLTADTSSTASLLVTFLPMVLILVFMYIILYLPQKKQDKKDAAMRASIEVGDTVITIGGVVGRVAAINDKDDTRETIIDYSIKIDEEITKKRKEFGMPVDEREGSA